MKKLRIVFMGTPDFAANILKALIEKKFQVVGVVTAADKRAGRGLKLHESAVKKYALSQNLPILQPKNLKNTDFLDALKSFQADLQIVVAFRMLPKEVWQLPKLGTFNLHASLLPDYRGASPIHWAIINGETKTGVTTFFIDDKIDTGEMILQKEIEITEEETVGDLHDKLMLLGADLVIETLNRLQKTTLKTTKQPTLAVKSAPKLTPENTRINWTKTLNAIYNQIRGLNPFPGAWTMIDIKSKKISAKIYEIKKEQHSHNFPIGAIITSKKEMKVAVKGGFIHILSIKLAGKKSMDVKSLLNGFTFDKESKMF